MLRSRSPGERAPRALSDDGVIASLSSTIGLSEPHCDDVTIYQRYLSTLYII
jgi:hypothetical protein